MKIFYPKITYNKVNRAQLFPLLKPFIKEGEFNDEQRQEMYVISKQDLSFVEDLEQADLAILPLSWNYYVKEKKQKEALDFIHRANHLNVKVWMVMLGDMGLFIPDFKKTMVFRASGNRSKLPAWHLGLPIFIPDPSKVHFKTTKLIERQYSNRPTVGFCGLANDRKWDAVKSILKIALKNIGYYLKLYPQTPEDILAAPYLRFQCLKSIFEHSGINDNIILRNQYRAGAITKEQREKSTREFYENIRDSDYILCARGAGNFSVRLYETLAMGRIPIYINTDGLLPLQDQIDWKKHVVWIEKNEISLIADKVMAFHQKLNEVKLNKLFKANRDLWVDKLRMGPFFKNYLNDY